MMRYIILSACLLEVVRAATTTTTTETINPNIVLDNVDRSMDLSTQIAKIINKITIRNDGTTPINTILFVSGEQKISPAYILAQVCIQL